MRIIICIYVFVLSFNLSAKTILSRIEAIDYPKTLSGDILIFLSTGEVAKISHTKLAMLRHIKSSRLNHGWQLVTLNDKREIVSIEAYETQTANEKSFDPSFMAPPDYVPSVLSSPEWAQKYFTESKRNPKESQCFNRAHVWSYDWFIKHKLNSSKMFIFFTRKFIREHKFEWWFHIAPYVHVVVNNNIRERVMDMKYTNGPSSVGNWVRRFVKDGPKCTTVKKYSDYANFPENGNCYLMRSSMYSYWPLDLENEELHGTVKTTWVPEEVNIAYEEAFDIIKQ
jgi:hypothetical protein